MLLQEVCDPFTFVMISRKVKININACDKCERRP